MLRKANPSFETQVAKALEEANTLQGAGQPEMAGKIFKSILTECLGLSLEAMILSSKESLTFILARDFDHDPTIISHLKQMAAQEGESLRSHLDEVIERLELLVSLKE